MSEVPQKVMDVHERKHVPVLLTEVLDLIPLRQGMLVVDATLGGGGYTRALLEKLDTTSKLIAFDWDEQAIRYFPERFADDALVQAALRSQRLRLVQAPYSELGAVLEDQKVDVIVADLGLSSTQLDDPSRGLSFQTDGPLDMRLNSRETVTAADIVNHWSPEALTELFQVYADEGEAERIAQAIVVARKQSSLTTTQELANLVKRNVVAARRHGRIHPATKVFQALRMAVNSEAKHLEGLLAAAYEKLSPGGRMIVVAFHSGEDGLVKRAFQKWSREDEWQLLTKKPIGPSEEETRVNPRARSAKLRCIQKAEGGKPHPR